MLSRFSEVLQNAADVLAPPATRLEDFEYHWKMVLNYYQNYHESLKVHVEDTRVPHHLHQMLQLIVDEEKEEQGGTVGPCLEAIIQRSISLLDVLAVLAAMDRPPGARSMALSLATALLRRTRRPCINSVNVYRPLQRMLVQCNESPASPTEKEEVELLLTFCGLVRKEPGLANIFTTPFVEDRDSLLSIPEDIQTLIPIKSKLQTPKKNPLFEVDMTPTPMKTVSIVRINKEDNCLQSNSSGEDHESCKSQKTIYEENDKFLLIDLLLSYLNSADNQVVLRACEGVMIVSSLPEDDIANLVTSSPACETIVDKLVQKYRAIPEDVDPNDVDQLNITWAYVAQDFGDKTHNRFHGYRELTSFFSWLDYIDTLMKECRPCIARHLCLVFRSHFLEAAAGAGAGAGRGAGRGALTAALLAKALRALDDGRLVHEFSLWLVGEGEGEGDSEWSVLQALIDDCLSDHRDLALETLRFFEAIIEKGTEHSMERLVLCRLHARGYCGGGPATALDDERDRLNDLSHARERERNREAMQQLQHEELVGAQVSELLQHEELVDAAAGEPLQHDERAAELLQGTARADVLRDISSFLLVVPRALLSAPGTCDHYRHDAHRHYQLWLDITSTYNWPTELNWNTASSTHSYDSRPEADIHLEAFNTIHTQQKTEKCKNSGSTSKIDSENIDTKRSIPDNTKELCPFSQTLVHRHSETSIYEEEFDEGPFLRMLFKLLSSMPDQPYQVNLHLTAIISKLALLPHPNLHEYLLNPSLPTSKKTRTLYKILQEVAQRLTIEVPRIKNYKKVIENTRLQLMSEDPAYDEIGDHNQLVESLIVLEEFCKELAAIAFVKYQHATQMNR